jgi:hypothetical protein
MKAKTKHETRPVIKPRQASKYQGLNKRTRYHYELKLNEDYANMYSLKEALNVFAYLRDGKISHEVIRRHFHNKSLGTLLRKLDPVLFDEGFMSW